jgi:hypothetical protein
MKHSLVFLAILAASFSAGANNDGIPVVAPAPGYVRPLVNVNTNQSASNYANLKTEGDSSSVYVLPAPVSAAALPGFNCPSGDSISFSIGWNFFSYASSRTRTEMECLDKVIVAQKVIAEMNAPVRYVGIDAPMAAEVKNEKFVVNECPIVHQEQYAAWRNQMSKKKVVKKVKAGDCK